MSARTTSPSPAESRYLEAIAQLGRGGDSVPAAAIARTLELSAPTVHEMLRRLARDGFVERMEDRGWVLTAAGRHEAAALRRRRRVIEQFLRTQTSMTEDEVATEADLLLAAISPKLEQHLRRASWPGERPCEASPLGRSVRRLRQRRRGAAVSVA
jgi:DtxR family Mn-dependent transcriptional regulator